MARKKQAKSETAVTPSDIGALDQRGSAIGAVGLGMQERFVLEYVRLALMGKPNGSKAARLAGYSVKTAYSMANQLLKKRHIKVAILQLTKKAMDGIEVDGPMILKELGYIAMAPIVPGYISAGDKTRALDTLGDHHGLWKGRSGDRIINIHITPLDEKIL